MAWIDTATIDLSTGDLLTETEYDAIVGNLAYLKLGLDSIIILEDQQTSGTAGGTATSGSWQTRTLNTEKTDVNSDNTLSSNQFTLAAGDYEISWRAPAFDVGVQQSRIQNATDATTVLTGSNANIATGDAGQTDSFGYGRFTIAASKALELQSQVTTTSSTNGYGVAGSFGTEVYSQVWLRRVA